MDRDSSVGIAIRYGLDGPEIESRWRRNFPHPSRPHLASYTMGTGSFPWVKRPGRGVDHPQPSSAEVRERVELYLYSPYGLSWPVLWWTVPLPLPIINTPSNSVHWLAKLMIFNRGYKSWSFAISPSSYHFLPLGIISAIFLSANSLGHSLSARDQEPHPLKNIHKINP